MNEGVVEASIAQDLEYDFQNLLQERFDEAKEIKKAKITPFLKDEWEGINRYNKEEEKRKTNVSEAKIKKLARFLYDIADADKLFKKTRRLLADRKKMIEETNRLDWAMAELLAYATLLDEGHNIRLSGQDVERGTFSHRHAVLKSEDSEEEYLPLNNIDSKNKGLFSIYNSPLSEYGVLGFDYGYALASPNSLTIWEAQFGDFSNGAQIMIDLSLIHI